MNCIATDFTAMHFQQFSEGICNFSSRYPNADASYMACFHIPKRYKHGIGRTASYIHGYARSLLYTSGARLSTPELLRKKQFLFSEYRFRGRIICSVQGARSHEHGLRLNASLSQNTTQGTSLPPSLALPRNYSFLRVRLHFRFRFILR